jgi:tRNA pseudouridine55 synthase
MSTKLPDNILLIDKPEGISSFDVIRRLRKKLHIKKMGHAGTLDPAASGLMIIGIDEGTKLMQEFLGLSKVYDAEILLGQKTDTGDREGSIIETRPVPSFRKEDIEKILESMMGEIELAVPLYSAVKRQGKALYAYAREGKEVEIPKKTMKVISYELISITEKTISLKWNVGSGTYIRSLALELGERLGTVATLIKLRRISIGDFLVDDAEKI